MKIIEMPLVKTILFFIFLTIISCDSNDLESKYLITTKVAIKEGKIDEVLKLFKETNPELVKDQSDWLKAIFSKNDEANTVMVQAYWKNKESYLRFSSSEEFQNTMQQFGKYFNGKPEIEINRILFEM